MEEDSAPASTLYTPDQQEDVRSLANGTGVSLAGSVSGRLIHALTDIWLARLLGPGGFGIYSIGWNLHHLLYPFTSLGLPNSTILFGVKYWKNDTVRFRGVFWAGTLALCISGGITALLAWISADWLALSVFGKPETAQIIKTVGLMMPFFLILSNSSAMTRVTRRMQFSIISNEIVSTVSMLAIFAILYWISGQFWAVLVAMVVSYSLAACIATIFVYRLFPELRQEFSGQLTQALKELLGFSIPTMLAGIFGASDLWLNRVLAGIFFPAEQVGLYQAASQFNNLFGILLSSVVATFMPIIASLHQTGQTQRLNDLYKITTKWSLYLNLPVVIVALLLPGDVMHFFYGTKYVQGAGLLVILTIGQLINVGTGATTGLFLMTGRQHAYLKLTIASFILNILGSIILIPYLGISAMAVGQLLSSLCDNIFGTIWLAHDTGLWPYDARYLKGLLATGIAAAVIWWAPTLNVGPMLVFIWRSGLGLVAYAATLWLLKLDREDFEMLNSITSRARGIFFKLPKNKAGQPTDEGK